MPNDNALPAEFNYQGYIREKIVRLKRLGVLAKPGSGKTRPIIDALVELGRIYPQAEDQYKFPYGPILVICTGSAVPTWTRQIPLWTNSLELEKWIFSVRGKKHLRVTEWSNAETIDAGIYVTNSSIFWRDYAMIMQVKWAAVVADEYHKFMLRRKPGKTFKLFRSLTRHVEVVVLATGSSLRKNPSSMWTLFTTTNPGKRFGSYWRFVKTWCIVDDNGFGQEVLGPKNVEGFKKLVDEHHAYVPAEVVAEQVPEGRRQPIYVEMTKSQSEVYNDLNKEMIAVLEDTVIVASNPLAKTLKLRQLLCCPKIIDPSLDMGGGFETIVDQLDVTPHCIIFVPFRPACDFIIDELWMSGYKNVYMLRGGITAE
ncbi:MAG: SNF2-related protein, partial [Nitrososphaerales archaeon]